MLGRQFNKDGAKVGILKPPWEIMWVNSLLQCQRQDWWVQVSYGYGESIK